MTSTDTGEEAATEIMQATCRILAREGYADLTTQKVADECGKSQGIIHYYYNTKKDLFIAVIDHLIDERSDQLNSLPDGDALVRLNAFFDLVLPNTIDTNDRMHATVNLAIHAQAPYNKVYRERLAERDQLLQNRLVGIIKDGTEQGMFTDNTPEQTAVSLLSMIDGAVLREIALNHEQATSTIRSFVDDFVQSELLSGDDNTNRLK